jgi:hypothetical protein
VAVSEILLGYWKGEKALFRESLDFIPLEPLFFFLHTRTQSEDCGAFGHLNSAETLKYRIMAANEIFVPEMLQFVCSLHYSCSRTARLGLPGNEIKVKDEF